MKEIQKPKGNLFAIGDIHGCKDALVRLIDRLDLTPSDQVVFIGDYIDRGPDSKGVIDYLIEFKAKMPNTIFLKGNHEDMFLSWLGYGGADGEYWVKNGGNATLTSYAVTNRNNFLPESHLNFYQTLDICVKCENLLFVHAGINPFVELEEQTEHDMLWIRNDFLDNKHNTNYTIIHGHTPTMTVDFDLPYRIGLDTGCVFGGILSCINCFTHDLYIESEK